MNDGWQNTVTSEHWVCDGSDGNFVYSTTPAAHANADSLVNAVIVPAAVCYCVTVIAVAVVVILSGWFKTRKRETEIDAEVPEETA